MDPVEVFTVSVSYVYRDEESGRMTERHLNQEFVADNPNEAIDIAIGWAKNRYEEVIKDWYKDSAIGCIKVGTKVIGGADENGCIDTRRGMGFFEWKYDWPGTLEQYVQSAKSKYSVA